MKRRQFWIGLYVGVGACLVVNLIFGYISYIKGA